MDTGLLNDNLIIMACLGHNNCVVITCCLANFFQSFWWSWTKIYFSYQQLIDASKQTCSSFHTVTGDSAACEKLTQLETDTHILSHLVNEGSPFSNPLKVVCWQDDHICRLDSSQLRRKPCAASLLPSPSFLFPVAVSLSSIPTLYNSLCDKA